MAGGRTTPFQGVPPCAAGPAAMLRARSGRARSCLPSACRPSPASFFGATTAPAGRRRGKASTFCNRKSSAAGCCGRSITTRPMCCLALLIIYLVQSILTRACRAPRELVFWATVGMAPIGAGRFPDRRLAPLGPAGLLCDQDAHQLLDAAAVDRQQPVEAGHRRSRPGTGHARRDSLLRPARRAVLRRLPAVADRPQRACPPGSVGQVANLPPARQIANRPPGRGRARWRAWR